MTLHCCSMLAEAEGTIVRLGSGHIDSACIMRLMYVFVCDISILE